MLLLPSCVIRPLLELKGPFWCSTLRMVMGYVMSLETWRTARGELMDTKPRVKKNVSHDASDRACSYG